MTNTKYIKVEHANAMLASTWHNLSINDTSIEIPAGLKIAPHTTVSGSYIRSSVVHEFEDALARAQEKWEQEHPAPISEELAARDKYLVAEADATYGGTAQSAYQVYADAIEESRSLAMAFEAGIDEEIAAYLRFVAGDRIVIVAHSGQEIAAQVVIKAHEGTLSAAAIDIVAAQDSSINVSIVVTGACEKEGLRAEVSEAGVLATEACKKKAYTGTALRVFAGDNAKVRIVRTQALGYNAVDLDDMGLFASNRAAIQLTQTVLGAAQTFTGVAADLRGDMSRIGIVTHYLGQNDQVHDFNYTVRHHGVKTECNLQANGVLAGKSCKTLRGTIDLIRGAKGAQGSENETVLLVDEGVHNKTVPTILCNEDDVAGNHGATIGHIRDEQMFYLASRGLSREVAENMFVTALMEAAALEAPDAESRAAITQLGEIISPGFAVLFNEES